MAVIKIKVKTNETTGSKTVLQVGEIRLGETYVLNSGYYKGCLYKVDYISPNKQIRLNGKQLREVHGVVVSSGIGCNAVVDDLDLVNNG